MSVDLLEETEEHSPWPAFVDLLSATTLVFVVLVGVVVWVLKAGVDEVATNRRILFSRIEGLPGQGSRFRVSDDGQFVRIVLLEEATFPQGVASWESLRPEGKRVLQDLANELNGSGISSLYRQILVQGHTDRIPFNRGGMTNWELSALRAAVVARYLVSENHVDPCKVTASGVGPYFPANPSSLQANRRIEILILPGRQDSTGATGCQR